MTRRRPRSIALTRTLSPTRGRHVFETPMEWALLLLGTMLAVVLLSSPLVRAQDTETAEPPEAPMGADVNEAEEEPMPEVAMEANVVGWLELSGALRDGPIPFTWVSKAEAEPSLGDVLSQLQTVAQGDQYMGIVIYLDAPELSLTEITELSKQMKAVSKAGKRVLVFAESYGLREYLLASAADLILLQNRGSLELSGLSIEEMYLGGTLEKIGVKADFVQVGEFKGAAEPLTNKEPSKQWSQNINNLLDDLYGQIVKQIATNRGMTVDQLEKLMGDSWTMQDFDYVKEGLIDRLVSRDMIDVTEVEFGDNFIWDDSMGISLGGSMNVESPFALFSMLFQEQQTVTTRPTIAVLHAAGEIHSGDSTRGDGMFAADTIGSRTMVRLLADIRDDSNIKGLVLRIDSPGGSALASEVIWQAVREVAEEKPVFCSVGNLAASGGYYIACAADQIYVSPQSILGSIGVVGGKLTMQGLYDWAGINVVQRNRGPLASMFNSVEPFTAEQREKVRASMQHVYDQFVNRIELGRGNRIADIDKVAKGRLFTGHQSVQNGLADKSANLEEAILDVADQLNLQQGQYDILQLPPPMSLQEFLQEFMRADAGQAPKLAAATPEMAGVLQVLNNLLGERTMRQLHTQLRGLMLLRNEHVLTIMPTTIIVK